MANFDALDDDGLRAHLRAKAQERGERFYVEQREDQWVAEIRSPSEFAGQVIPVDDGAVVLPGEAVIKRINGPDRRTAMLRLARLLAGEYGLGG